MRKSLQNKNVQNKNVHDTIAGTQKSVAEEIKQRLIRKNIYKF